MPENDTLGASFSIDVTQLKAGLAQANRLIRESESEFKAAAAGMDDWTKSQEGLEARIGHLNKACELQQKKVDALQSEYDRLVADGLDPTSAAAVKLRTDINKEKEALAKNQKELAKQKKALASVKDESKDTRTASQKLRDEISKQEEELQTLGEQYQNLALEQGTNSREAKALKSHIEGLNKKLREAKKLMEETGIQVGGTGKAAEGAAGGFTIAKGAIAGFIANGLTSLVSAATNAISSVWGLAESTREYRSIMASLDESSQLAGYTAEQTAQTYEHLYGVLGDAQTVATSTANLQAMGLEQSKLEQLTNGVIGAWAKYGDSIPIDGLSEAVNHTMQLGEVQGTLTDVIEWGGGTVEDFNAKLATCSSETERADMIMQLLAEQGLTEAGEAWQENNKSIVDANKAQAENERITAEWGARIEPITTKVREGFNKLLSKLLELTEDVDIAAFGALIESAFSTLTDDILPVIIDGLGWIIDNKDIVIAGAVAIGAAFAAWKVVGIVQSAKKALEGMTVAQWLLNTAMNANPIGLIVAAVAALIAIFVVLWKKCDGFREFWINLWDNIKKACGAALDWIKQAWSSLTAWFSESTAAVGRFFSDLWSGLKQGAADAWQGVKDTFSAVASFFGDIFSKAWSKVKQVFSTGGKIFSGIKEGIANVFKTVVNKIISGVNKVVAVPFNAINGMLNKIRSVSVVGVKPFTSLWSKNPLKVPQIPLLEKGAIVRKATHAIIGENGTEVVMPLEKNTGWIKKLAGEIAAQQPQGVVVNQTNNFSQAHSRLEMYKTKQATAAAVRQAMNGA